MLEVLGFHRSRGQPSPPLPCPLVTGDVDDRGSGMLGHSDISITLGIYQHVTPGMAQEGLPQCSMRFSEDR